ncbi:MAG: glycosyltransferase [Lachnospiraceae bacterium]|nr:glycosyltransferase [Lachnospiraceae bacterium]
MYNVNIIMSVYNGEKYLKDQIESILKSTVSNWKLYIFDDCSTDSSIEIAEDYANRFKGRIFAFKNRRNMGSTISFLHNLTRVSKRTGENERLKIVNGFRSKVRKPIGMKLKGIIQLKNSAVNFVKGPRKEKLKSKCTEYYMFCDQDDFWLMDKIFLTIKKLKSLELHKGKHKPCMVFTDAILVDKDLKFVDKSFYKTNHMKARKCDFAHMLMENKAIGCTVALNQAAADVLAQTFPSSENGFRFRNDYDYIRFHDWWMGLICSAMGAVRFYRVPTVMYRQHTDNQVGQTDFSSYVKNRAEDMENLKQRINATIHQAECFYRCYGSMLKKKKLKILKAFIKLNEYNPVVKRLIILRYGFLKSGLVRNVALLMSI